MQGFRKGSAGSGWSLHHDAGGVGEADWRREVMLALGCNLSRALDPNTSMWLGFFATWWPQGSMYF